jgi:hypothetical protein
MKWTFHDPHFAYRQMMDDLHYPWTGHTRFGYDLVANMKPKVVAELGTHRGTSLFAFAQAAKDLNLGTRFHAIDCWEGDVHSGHYGDDVLNGVKRIKEACYSGVDIELMRMYFDEARPKIADGTVDMLHIDGLHTYEAVKHDFETWLPKCRPDAVILFHDIRETMGDFGVYVLWAELKKKYATLEFHHSHGLGVLFLDGSRLDAFAIDREEFYANYYWRAYQDVKAELYISKGKERELEALRNSRPYKLLKGLKGLIGR